MKTSKISNINITGSFETTFENGGFWEYYKDLERQFESFLEYVPYLENNENVCSFRLSNLLLSIGAHIDSAFKKIVQFPKISNNYPHLFKNDGSPKKLTIRDYVPIICDYALQSTPVEFKRLPKRDVIFPFSKYEFVNKKLKTPEWWQAYNAIKHDFSRNFIKANLRQVRDALAGAFLLNVVHEPAIGRLNNFGLIKPKNGAPNYSKNDLDNLLTNSNPWATIETPIFFYDYDKGPTYNLKIERIKKT
jgi:hypothetical protein